MADRLEYDVIVVGGGPAGASAAWALKRQGLSVLVLDLAPFPRDKLCAGWITPQVLTDLEFQPTDYPHRFLTFNALDVAVKGRHRLIQSPQHSIRRFEFDHWLLQRSNAEVHAHRVRHLRREKGLYIIDDRFRARYLIGAGGTRCPVYRELFRPLRPREHRLQVATLELEYACASVHQDCHLWFFDNGLPGYAWFVPKARGYLNVGVGAVAARLNRNGDNLRRHWQLLTARLVEEGLISVPPAKPGGYSYYLRGKHQASDRVDNAYLVGDAAGLATRDMCEGIGPAVRSGLLAARAIVEQTDYTHCAIESRTLGNGVLGFGLDYAMTRRRV